MFGYLFDGKPHSNYLNQANEGSLLFAYAFNADSCAVCLIHHNPTLVNFGIDGNRLHNFFADWNFDFLEDQKAKHKSLTAQFFESISLKVRGLRCLKFGALNNN